jgi:hypothetical protein
LKLAPCYGSEQETAPGEAHAPTVVGMSEYDERPEDHAADPWDEGPVELIRPEDFLGNNGIPGDARRMGFDRNTEEGALIALAGSLNPGKPSHRLVAWVLLVAFALPLMLGLTHLAY